MSAPSLPKASPSSLRELGAAVRLLRRVRDLTQEQLAAQLRPPTTRTTIALLEQGRRLPEGQVLASLGSELRLPEEYWRPFNDPAASTRVEFEDALSELAGRPVCLASEDRTSAEYAQEQIAQLFTETLQHDQARARFNSILVHYGIPQVSTQFFATYIQVDAFRSLAAFREAVQKFQKDAIRLYSTFAEAYTHLSDSDDLGSARAPLQSRDPRGYHERTEWTAIRRISADRLADLGYISAAQVKKENAERQLLSSFLRDLGQNIRQHGPIAVGQATERVRRKIDSLLRKFGSTLPHGLLSPLFHPDPDQLEREASFLAPKAEADLARMAETQSLASRNLAAYLTADYLDVYVATSMRSQADFVSVNEFVGGLFAHAEVRPLKLRYFDPTQSWIEDRVAKGLVEALMLRRADYTVYMAQKEDTFGKDSEASVSLGQGKPVLVYVPKLLVPEVDVDTEVLGATEPAQLEAMIASHGEPVLDGSEPDASVRLDQEALHARLLWIRLRNANVSALAAAVRSHWADFDLYSEATRIDDESLRAAYRSWLDSTRAAGVEPDPGPTIREHVISILVATAMRFERRATIFREIHPLALQVILSSGVLNGILVVRSVEQCAHLLRALVLNTLDLDLVIDEQNYRLKERRTRSTLRVISRHELIQNAFAAHYARSS
ncbi:MAG: helix-turn-helix domain-containing protein [Deltaproteobacteria bacterium]|nr:helix-turn-helix domain-containing protein [Deltaproteobacteria bacterium]